MRNERGFSLVELLVTMVVFTAVLGGAMTFLRSQQRSFHKGADQMGILQNISFGADNLHSQLRTTGANTLDAQPPVVYASSSVFAFNADYVSNDAKDISAVYIDPDASAAQVDALRQAQKIAIPGSSFIYPSMDYLDKGFNSPAETIIFFFTPDTDTPRLDDYVLKRQVNGQPAEVLIRNVLPDSTNLPFFRYYKLRTPGGNVAPNLVLVPASELPVSHLVARHGSPADTLSRVDSLRSVLVSYIVTNGDSGTKERRERISMTIPLPNMGLKQLKVCGGAPLLNQTLSAVFDNADGVDKVTLGWLPAYDENAGERDVIRYVIWRRKVGEVLGDPLTSVAAGQTNYIYVDTQDLVPSTVYEYQLAAQDCSPKLSSPTIAPLVTIPAAP